MLQRRARNRLKAEINIVPYIDVMLVLLVIFMVTAPLLNQGVEVNLPKAASEPIDVDPQRIEVIVLSVTKGNQCYLNVGPEKAELVDCQTLEPRDDIHELLKHQPQPPVLVRADRQVLYERVILAMTALKSAGALKVGLSTAPPESP
ncbi:MAG: protein TolR [Candidatus Contendobacter odensis]|uniref:Protein TolR n=1 Tax=Candidatus Contendibacter odensensis TaxID=1400860 RepID=A0A2G6PEX5_9GAMM|nr:MAG: protein TolR [Candidatus Contendobacter odensis]